MLVECLDTSSAQKHNWNQQLKGLCKFLIRTIVHCVITIWTDRQTDRQKSLTSDIYGAHSMILCLWRLHLPIARSTPVEIVLPFHPTKTIRSTRFCTCKNHMMHAILHLWKVDYSTQFHAFWKLRYRTYNITICITLRT